MSVSHPVVIGVDVGGTNTDAVVLQENEVIGAAKRPTTVDVVTGVHNAVVAALKSAVYEIDHTSGVKGLLLPENYTMKRHISLQSVNVGTTLFLNAVLQKANLQKVAVVRLCGKATLALPPFCDFPEDLRKILEGPTFCINGGFHFDGCKEIAAISKADLDEIVLELKNKFISHVAVSGVFSPLNSSQEEKVTEMLKQLNPSLSITQSHQIGSLGILPRENAAIMNEALKPLAFTAIEELKSTMSTLGCPMFFTQNNGTVISADDAQKMPVLTFASGPTNSMRGAAFLTGLKDAVVVDVGGTSTDVGLLHKGFPTQAAVQSEVAGVKTNFRMPDVFSIALGGGSIVKKEECERKLKVQVGPESVGFNITKQSLSYGGSVTVATDIANAAELCQIGLQSKNIKEQIPREVVRSAEEIIQRKIEECVNFVKLTKEEIPVVLVGGGSVIVRQSSLFDGSTHIVQPKYFDVANAVGAALSQISGNIDTLIDLSKSERTAAVEQVLQQAQNLAIAAGANPQTLQTVDREEIPLSYLPGNVLRMKVMVVGDIDWTTVKSSSDFQLQQISLEEKEAEVTTEIPPTLKISQEARRITMTTLEAPAMQDGDWLLTEADIECIAIGAGILGCGGGGNPYLAKTLAQKLLKEGKTIRVIHPEKAATKLSPSDFVAPFGWMGAPTVIDELLYNCDEFLSCLQTADWVLKQGGNLDHFDLLHEGGVSYFNTTRELDTSSDIKKIKAIVPWEIGGANSIVGLISGAVSGLPVVDSDGMGRAFPEIQQCTMNIYDTVYCPAVVACRDGRQTIGVTAATAKHLEDHFRSVCIDMGCIASLTLKPMHPQQLKKKIIPFSVSRAWQLGRTVVQAHINKTCPLQAILQHANGQYICKAKVSDIQRKIEGGFTKGSFELEGLEEYHGRMYQVVFQNEFLILRDTTDTVHKVLALVPDLITIVDLNTGHPLSTDTVRFGLRVAILHLPVSPMLSTEDALAVIGPEAFGYKDIKCSRILDYVVSNPVPLL